MQWQPIETAPTDGKYYLLFRCVDGFNDIRQGKWKGDMWGGNGWDYDFPSNLKNGTSKYMPTHWMPPLNASKL
jgi:hypothetical protein